MSKKRRNKLLKSGVLTKDWFDYYNRNKKQLDKHARIASIIWIVILLVSVYIDNVFIKSVSFALFMIERVYNSGLQRALNDHFWSYNHNDFSAKDATHLMAEDPGVPSVITFIKLIIGVLSLGAFIIPGVIILTRLRFAHLVYFNDNRLGAFESIKESWRLTKGRTWGYLKDNLKLSFPFVMFLVGYLALAAYVSNNTPMEVSVSYEIIDPKIKILTWILIFLTLLLPNIFKMSTNRMNVYKVFEFNEIKN